MIKAIIFDIGGVVIDAKVGKDYEILIKKLKISKAQFDSAKNKYIKDARIGKLSAEDLLIKISSELKIDKNKLKKLWKASYSEAMILNREVLRIVDSLKKKGYVTSVITNVIPMYSQLSKKRGVYRKFFPVIISHEVGMKKPEKRIYKNMLEKLNFKPNECVFIDDIKKHLAPAKRLGMKTILFKNAKRLKRELKKLGVKF